MATDTPQVVGTLFNLGVLADIQGDYDSANRYLLQALTIQQKLAPNSQYLVLIWVVLATLRYMKAILPGPPSTERRA